MAFFLGPILTLSVIGGALAQPAGTLDGCREPDRTAELLQALRKAGWSKWSSARAFELIPDAQVSRSGQGRELISFVRTGRVIAGDVECEEAVEFEAAGDDSDGPWALAAVTLIYSAQDQLLVERARDRFVAAIGVPSAAEQVDTPSVGGHIGGGQQWKGTKVSAGRTYTWTADQRRHVLRVIEGRGEVSRIWLDWGSR